MNPASAIVKTFVFQSYYDNTFLQNAIVAQPSGQQIIGSTPDTSKGRAVGLHPSSQAPVAIRFRGTAQPVMLIKPGQILWPGGPFDGFDYGLPAGWLGGGMVRLEVFKEEVSKSFYAGENPEIIFHRMRLLIQADSVAIPAIVNNWPIAFPWQNAKSQSSTATVPQPGAPGLVVTPTRTLIRPRISLTSAQVPATIRFLFRQTDDFDMKSDGTYVTTDQSAVDVGLAQGTLATTAPYLVYMLNGPETYMGGPNAGVVLTNPVDTGSVLAGVYVDIERRGRL